MKKWVIKISLIFCLALFSYLGWVKIRTLDNDSNLPLAIKWEGFYLDKNYRDVGSSINQCYGRKVLEEGKILRSNGWFSGWDCKEVGSPDIIYSLNYNPQKKEKYFCWNSEQGKPQIGQYFNPDIELNDLEHLKNWDNELMKQSTCRFIDNIFQSIVANKKVLYHCSAGRDRTGTFSALITALAAEATNQLNDKMLDAIECDYRKTQSLSQRKYGRMKRFLTEIRKSGSIEKFIQTSCGINQFALRKVKKELSADITELAAKDNKTAVLPIVN